MFVATGSRASAGSLGLMLIFSRKGFRDTEGGSQASPRGDMSDPWTGEIADPYCRSL